MQISAFIPEFDPIRSICARSRLNGPVMPDDLSALQLVLSGDHALLAIVRLSLVVSLSAVLCAALIGIPLGALIALTRFPAAKPPSWRSTR